MKKITIIGIGVVGKAFCSLLESKNCFELKKYDKKEKYNDWKDCFPDDLFCVYLCLPTPYNEECNGYDLSPFEDVLSKLTIMDNLYCPIIIMSTVLPGTVDKFQSKFTKLKLMHMPEFLSASTSIYDMNNSISIQPVYIGLSQLCPSSLMNDIRLHTQTLFPNRSIWIVKAKESESIKSFINVFYATKLSLFLEYHRFCEENDISFDLVRQGILQSAWIDPMHTIIPGKDGLKVGGECLPKDTHALSHVMGNDSLVEKVSLMIKKK
jgi:UDP-glucose 6-dehydrogenase